jgi:ribonuclease D
VLLSLCRAKPKTQEQLMAFRGLQGEAKNNSVAILEAVTRGLEAKKNQGALPPRERRVIPTAEEQKLVDVLKAVVALVADGAGLSPRFLCNVDDLTQIVTSQSNNPDDWIKSGALNETAAPILGETLAKFLKGDLAIRVNGRKVELR